MSKTPNHSDYYINRPLMDSDVCSENNSQEYYYCRLHHSGTWHSYCEQKVTLFGYAVY